MGDEVDRPRKPLGGLAVLVAGLTFIAASIIPNIAPQPNPSYSSGNTAGGAGLIFVMGLGYAAFGVGLIKDYKDELRNIKYQ